MRERESQERIVLQTRDNERRERERDIYVRDK